MRGLLREKGEFVRNDCQGNGTPFRKGNSNYKVLNFSDTYWKSNNDFPPLLFCYGENEW